MSFWDQIKSALAGPPKPKRAATQKQPQQTSAASPAQDETALSRSFAARDAYWADLGTVETDVLGHLISPSFMGGPA